MPPKASIYRVELAKSNRAGCKAGCTEDKERKKILKNTLRFGVWTAFSSLPPSNGEERLAWVWRHWGCVTPKQLSNFAETVTGGNGKLDFNMVDGLDELDEEDAATVVRALENGRVDDEDWNGDPEKNHAGSRGGLWNISAVAKKAELLAKLALEPAVEKEAKTSKKGAAAGKKKKSRVLEISDEDEAEGEGEDDGFTIISPPPSPEATRAGKKPAAAAGKKRKARVLDISDEEEDEAIMSPPPSTRTRKNKTADVETTTTRGRKKTKADAIEDTPLPKKRAVRAPKKTQKAPQKKKQKQVIVNGVISMVDC